MIIKNFKELSKNPKKKTALKILEAGLESAKPQNSLKKILYQKACNLEFPSYLAIFQKVQEALLLQLGRFLDIQFQKAHFLQN